MIMEGRKENNQVIPPEAGAWLVCGGRRHATPTLPHKSTTSGGPTPHKSSDFPGVISQISETKKILQGNSTIVAWRTARESLSAPSGNSFGYTWKSKICVASCYRTRQDSAQRTHQMHHIMHHIMAVGCAPRAVHNAFRETCLNQLSSFAVHTALISSSPVKRSSPMGHGAAAAPFAAPSARVGVITPRRPSASSDALPPNAAIKENSARTSASSSSSCEPPPRAARQTS